MIKQTCFLIFILSLSSVTTPAVRAAEKSEKMPSLDLPELVLVIGNKREAPPEEERSAWVTIEPTLTRNVERQSEIEHIGFCPSDRIMCRLALGFRDGYFVGTKTAMHPDEDRIKGYLEQLAETVDTDPVNATFKVEDSGIVSFAPDQKGIAIDIEKSTRLIADSMLAPSAEPIELALPVTETEPEIKSGDVNTLGINTLIGEGTSNFRGSPKNRIFNINVATEKFNGVLIKPGEEFSFVTTLGPVDGEHGYAPELVIKQDRTEPEFGGGICQVSTTAFRAAINSGLKITARRNHAYPVAYYNPQGMDATVYVPRPDLKFINNTPGHILIQTKIEGTVLTFQFFGTSDGRTVEITGPKVLERNPDGSMKTTFSQKVTDASGNIIIDDAFKSSYDSPSKYPHPGEEKLTQKPKGWSDKEWKKYRATNGI